MTGGYCRSSPGPPIIPSSSSCLPPMVITRRCRRFRIGTGKSALPAAHCSKVVADSQQSAPARRGSRSWSIESSQALALRRGVGRPPMLGPGAVTGSYLEPPDAHNDRAIPSYCCQSWRCYAKKRPHPCQGRCMQMAAITRRGVCIARGDAPVGGHTETAAVRRSCQSTQEHLNRQAESDREQQGDPPDDRHHAGRTSQPLRGLVEHDDDAEIHRERQDAVEDRDDR